MPVQSLRRALVSRSYAQAQDAISTSSFPDDQKALLHARVALWQRRATHDPAVDPVGLLSLVTEAHGAPLDQRVEQLGAMCLLIAGAYDVIDDVQDDDLKAKPEEHAGSSVAFNNGLALLSLGQDTLRQLCGQIPEEQVNALWRTFTQGFIRAVGGQHVDLTSLGVKLTPASVMLAYQGKTCSAAMFAQMASILAGATGEQSQCWYSIYEGLIQIGQVLNDLQDIFGKDVSPDLAVRRTTYPVAQFYVTAHEDMIERFHDLQDQLPDSLRSIRELLYEAGTMDAIARVLEEIRCTLHSEVVALGLSGPSIRTLLHVIDKHCAALYVPSLLDSSKAIVQPSGGWHDVARELLRNAHENLVSHGAPKSPELLPWHLPPWAYDFHQGVIFYPDMEEQSAELLPLYSELLGLENMSFVDELLRRQAPVVMAHEFFHYWRHAAGRMSEEHWYEEWVAQQLAVAYAKEFCPELLQEARPIFARILEEGMSELGERGCSLLDMLKRNDCERGTFGAGYQVNMRESMLVQLALVEYLMDHGLSLSEGLERWLH